MEADRDLDEEPPLAQRQGQAAHQRVGRGITT
jgi:hypothetical protein